MMLIIQKSTWINFYHKKYNKFVFKRVKLLYILIFYNNLKKEINLNLSLFMLAGYETTSTSLTYITYILAKYPEEQKVLIDEIDSFYRNVFILL